MANGLFSQLLGKHFSLTAPESSSEFSVHIQWFAKFLFISKWSLYFDPFITTIITLNFCQPTLDWNRKKCDFMTTSNVKNFKNIHRDDVDRSNGYGAADTTGNSIQFVCVVIGFDLLPLSFPLDLHETRNNIMFTCNKTKKKNETRKYRQPTAPITFRS